MLLIHCRNVYAFKLTLGVYIVMFHEFFHQVHFATETSSQKQFDLLFVSASTML